MNAPGIHNHWPYVVFDLDGTLVDTIDLIVTSFAHAFTDVLGPARADRPHPDEAEIRSWIGRPLAEVFESGWPDQAAALVSSYVTFNLANTERLIRGYEGVRELVVALVERGVSVGVATSKRREAAQLALDLMDFPTLGALVGLEDTATHKPDPAPVLEALRRLGGTPAQAVYVGDAVVDVRAGQAAGMSTVAVTWGAGHRSDLEAANPSALALTPQDLAVILSRGPKD